MQKFQDDCYRTAYAVPDFCTLPKFRFDDPDSRTDYILSRLLSAHSYVTGVQLTDEMYISQSSLTADLARVRREILPFHLRLISKSHYGLMIDGVESDKRRLIVSRNIRITDGCSDLMDYPGLNTRQLSQILTEALMKWQFKISDIVFQNLLLHLSAAILRMKNGYYLEDSRNLPNIYRHAQDISSEIIHKICDAYQVDYSSEEVKSLALNLQCKQEYSQSDSISQEINDFVFHTLQAIRDKYGIDFTGDLNLRINLAMHTKPLIARMQSNVLLKNSMTFNIKQKYSFAFDLASEYSYHLSRKFGIKLTDDEISYLALHFIVGLQKTEHNRNGKHVLLISEQRKSNTILIQQQLLQWFSDTVFSLDLANMQDLHDINISGYDVILTTDENTVAQVPNAILINFFLNENDHIKIDMALCGIINSNDILRHFFPDLFYAGPVSSKEDLIKLLCGQAEKRFPTDGKLYQSVKLHEEIANTYFGNAMAMPHPDQPMSVQSFICVGIPDKPLKWDNEENIRLVFLVCLEKNNPAALQIWQYLSFLISDEDRIMEIASHPTYDYFIQVITDFYKKILGR
ncbi:MAG: PRD domain-containing protein [Atopobium sp.]|nr:PRD domain-containing protein [Atopobium sp.]